MARSTRVHARRSQPATFQIRVDLDDAKPPIWRRLLLSSELMLDELHAVLQPAMGWTDSHLHQFLVGENKVDRFAEQFHMQFMLDEGADGVLENRVRLDELLTEPTDRLFYRYDFGDGWEHTLVAEKVLPRAGDEPPALCIGGARACPPEDWRDLGIPPPPAGSDDRPRGGARRFRSHLFLGRGDQRRPARSRRAAGADSRGR
ncbi:plasmid pRiA4b ORF-3 family protein [Rhodococcus koreensis]|uniref:plasmid pRiA4b ORF-3 family protein n=1 Tax=Rhodococcus koreensis TaxID=99653 RepID=UPI0036702553